MKRLKNLWPQLIAFDNLLLAWRKARLGKTGSNNVLRFHLGLEREILALQRELQSGDYRPGPYHLFTIYERKPRLIAAATFRDRVVHHALMNLIEAPLDRRFIDDSYACRRGKGTHRAVDRYQDYAKHYRYALQLDIQRYFPSIDHDRLKHKLRHRIADPQVLWLIDTIIDHSPVVSTDTLDYFPGDDLFTPLSRRQGIPIGNLTSQFFANLYLDDLDHWIKETLRVPAYLRYVDDLILLHHDKAQLHDWHQQLRERLAQERLRFHIRKARVTPTRAGLTVLGYRVWPSRRRLRNDNGLRFRRHLRAMARGYQRGELSLDDITPRVRAWIGHAIHGETEGLRAAMFYATPLLSATSD